MSERESLVEEIGRTASGAAVTTERIEETDSCFTAAASAATGLMGEGATAVGASFRCDFVSSVSETNWRAISLSSLN